MRNLGELFIVWGIPALVIVTSWLIGRKVFSALEKRPAKKANSISLIVALVAQVLIYVALIFAIGFSGGFSR